MRQAYDYWQDQPGTYHRRRARPPGPAGQGAGPNARSRAPRPGLTPGPLALRRQARGLSPVQAASDARARLPAPRRSVPQGGPGAELPMRGGPHGPSLASPGLRRPQPPSASARSRRLQTPGRVSPRLGGARHRPGWGPSCPCGVAPSGARSPAPGLRRPRLARPRPRLLLVHTFGAPAPPRVKPQNGRGGERPPPPPLPFSGGEERPGSRLSAAHLPTGGEKECTGTADTNPGCNYLVRGYSPSMHYFWRGDMPHFSPPLPFQPRAGARPRRARSGAPACAGLRQSPTPAAGASSTSAGLSGAPAGGGQWWYPDPRSRRAFDLGRPERGASACRAAVVPDPRGLRAVDLGRPEQGARTCQAAAVTQPLRACRRPWPARHPCRRVPARRSPRGPSAAGVTAAISNWPAAPAAGQPKQARAPVAGGLAPFSHYF